MPLVVTDSDVLAQIATDDGLAKAVDGELVALGTKAPPATVAAWVARHAAYLAWAEIAKKQLEGGFFGGAWLGVPELGNQAIAYGQEFKGWQTILNDLAAGRPTSIAPAPVSPSDAADQNAHVELPSVGGDTKLLVGVGLALAAILLWRSR